MNHSNILCDEMDSLYGWSACTTSISGWVRCIPYISKLQLICDKGGMLRHCLTRQQSLEKFVHAVDELLHITTLCLDDEYLAMKMDLVIVCLPKMCVIPLVEAKETRPVRGSMFPFLSFFR